MCCEFTLADEEKYDADPDVIKLHENGKLTDAASLDAIEKASGVTG